MTSSTITAVNDNEPMDPPHPRADGPRRRRAFSASDKIAHLHAYEQACEHGEGGAYLRREGSYSSLIRRAFSRLMRSLWGRRLSWRSSSRSPTMKGR
jgi:hypothetical protein